METPKKRLDISDWVENQNKDFSPSSLARYLEHPESPGTTSSSSSPNELSSPKWGESSAASSTSSSSSLLSPSLLKQLSSQYAKGELVAVRCNQHKWLLGEVKRLSPRGIRVWVGEAGLLVNVPKQLLATHLLKMSSVEGLHSLPPGESMIATATMENVQSSRYLVQCVRPAHLSHRQLYLPSKRNICAICREAVILEDEAVAPWDCEHNCHIDCIQDKPRFFSTTTCPICAEAESPSSTTASSSPHSPSTAAATTEEETSYQQNPVVAAATTTVLSARKLQTIDENTPELLVPVPKVLKSALKKQQTFDGTGNTTTTMIRGNSAATSSSSSSAAAAETAQPSSSATTASAASAASSLAERMKRFSIAGAPAAASASSAPAAAAGVDMWVTVIKDGHNTRHTVSQQQFEHMAKAKENTFSSKAAKKQAE